MTMTTTEEELFLTQQLLDARRRLDEHKLENSRRKFQQNQLEFELDAIKQAMVDYCTGNGLKQFNTEHYTITLSTSESVDAPDVIAIPNDYLRVRMEPNKEKIRAERPEGNWYTIKETPSVRIVRKDV